MALNFGIDSLFKTSIDSNLGLQEKPRATFTKEFFVATTNPTTTVNGYWKAEEIGSSSATTITTMLPADFTTVKKISWVIIATTGHNNWDMYAAIASLGAGGDSDIENDSAAFFQEDLQSDKLDEIDITKVLDWTSLKARDYLLFTIQNSHVSESFYLLGIRIEYE